MKQIHIIIIVFILFLLYVIRAETSDIDKFNPHCQLLYKCNKDSSAPHFLLRNGNMTTDEAKMSIRRVLRALEGTVYWRISFLTALILSFVLIITAHFFNIAFSPAYICLIIIVSFAIIYYMMNFVAYHYYSKQHYEIEDYLESIRNH